MLAALGTGEAVIGVETSEDPEEDAADDDEVPTGDKGRYSWGCCWVVVLEVAAETETTLWGQVTRGTSSHRGKDLTDTWTDDVLPTSEKKVDFSLSYARFFL